MSSLTWRSKREPSLEPLPHCFMPYRHDPYNNHTLYIVMRTASDPSLLAPTRTESRGVIGFANYTFGRD